MTLTKPEIDLDDLREVFERFVVRSEDCWGWTGKSLRNGYPLLKCGWPYTHTIRSSRAAWMLDRGPIPPGICVLHRCDNPMCSNPDHLFLGTQAENVADMMSKGRSKHQTDPKGAWLPRGQNHGMSKLTADQVRDIRLLASTTDFKDLARRFNISLSYVYHVVRRRTWQHV